VLANGKHQEMRRQPALSAAGHHDRDTRGHLFGGDAEMLRQGGREGHCRVAAGEVVDATIAFGLPEDRDDIGRRDQPRFDQPQDRRDVAGVAHRHAMDCAFQ
jgi:hypothetical protein